MSLLTIFAGISGYKYRRLEEGKPHSNTPKTFPNTQKSLKRRHLPTNNSFHIMEELTKLELKHMLLLKEIELVRAQIEYVRKYNVPEQQKEISSPSSSQSQDEAIPEQTATGKESTNPLIPVHLVKMQSEVISTPFMKVEANPEQTAPGKDSTNPLKAVDLLKIQTEVQTSKTLEKLSELNLRPNGGIPIPLKTKEQSLAASQEDLKAQSFKNFYVVYNGPNAGIYTQWSIASQATSGISGISHKKFKSFQEAKVSANLYTTQMMKPPLQLINSAEGLKPSFKQALKKTDKAMTVLGYKNTENLIINLDEDDGSTIYDSFQYFYELGRTATEEQFVEHRFFTNDKNNISYFNFYPNANAELIYEAYVNGLVSLIYPSKNLLEISNFPKGIREAIKKFKTKCVKNNDKDIFIKIQSTIPFWDEDYEEEVIRPFHFIQLGVIKEKIYSPSKVMEVTLEKKDLQAMAFRKYSTILEKVLSYKAEDKIKINYAQNNCLIISQSHQHMTTEEQEVLYSCQKTMANSKAIFGIHYQQICKDIGRIIQRTKTSGTLLCPYCKDSEEELTATNKQMADNSGPSTIN